MKKNVVRIVALALVLLLALSAVPLGALASDYEWSVYREFYDVSDPSMLDYIENYIPDPEAIVEDYEAGSTIKVKDWDKLTAIDDSLYDFAGFIDWKAFDKIWEKYEKEYADPTKEVDLQKFMDKYDIPLVKKDIKVPAEPKTDKEKNEWIWEYIGAFYTPHKHKVTCWIADPTNHWVNCKECKEQFIGINWHFDNDGDDFCDVCEGEIYYYDITELDVEGGKVTADLDTARYRDMVNVKVEVAEGYKLHKVRVFKVREDGSKDQIMVKPVIKGETYTFKMPSFNVEVTAEFVKTK